MKKTTIAILSIVIMSGCTNKPTSGKIEVDKGGQFTKIDTVDGCEYIITAEYSNGYGHRTMTHKGNCKNHKQ